MKTLWFFYFILFNLYLLMLTYNLLKAQSLTLTYMRARKHARTHTHIYIN